jgi:hypothetical protein
MKAETIARDWDGWIERPDFAPSAANFAHYLALRCHDIRPLQLELTARGLWFEAIKSDARGSLARHTLQATACARAGLKAMAPIRILMEVP